MRILLFGGFLGSGKTSTILRVAKEITENRKETVAVIENEIGEAGVDDQLFVGSGLRVKRLFGGCVCCQVTGDLVNAVDEIAKTISPDWLIIEMTGLAVPGNVAKIIRQHNSGRWHCKTVTIVDAGRWPLLIEALEPLIVSQVKESDFVIINKADIIGADINAIIDDIRVISRQVPIMTACATKPLPVAVIEEVFDIE